MRDDTTLTDPAVVAVAVATMTALIAVGLLYPTGPTILPAPSPKAVASWVSLTVSLVAGTAAYLVARIAT